MELTTKQRGVLECLHEAGYKYLVTDEAGDICAYAEKPFKDKYLEYWSASDTDTDTDTEWFYLYKCFDPKLTSWEDEEPLNIAKVLGIIE